MRNLVIEKQEEFLEKYVGIEPITHIVPAEGMTVEETIKAHQEYIQRLADTYAGGSIDLLYDKIRNFKEK